MKDTPCPLAKKVHLCGMKKVILTFLLSAYLLNGFAITDKIKLGLSVSPGMGWLKPLGKNIGSNANGVAYAMQYGIVLDFYFKGQNYGISTGLFGGMDGGSVFGRDSFAKWNAGRYITESYSNHYVTLPIYLKLKTNPIKNFRLYGQIGFSFVFTVSSRASFDQAVYSPYWATAVTIDRENILKGPNDVQKLIPEFKYQIFDARLSVGGGFEYETKAKVSPFFGIYYYNGFVSVMNDGRVNPKGDGVVMRNLLFSFGVMF